MSKECTQFKIDTPDKNFMKVKIIRQQWSEADQVWYPAKIAGKDEIIMGPGVKLTFDAFGYNRYIITESE